MLESAPPIVPIEPFTPRLRQWHNADREPFAALNADPAVMRYFTGQTNRPSRAVMERIGMVDSGEDFDHPALPEGSELRRHCVYNITNPSQARTPTAGLRHEPFHRGITTTRSIDHGSLSFWQCASHRPGGL